MLNKDKLPENKKTAEIMVLINRIEDLMRTLRPQGLDYIELHRLESILRAVHNVEIKDIVQ